MTSQFCGHARATRVTRVAEVATMVAGWRKLFQTKVSPTPARAIARRGGGSRGKSGRRGREIGGNDLPLERRSSTR